MRALQAHSGSYSDAAPPLPPPPPPTPPPTPPTPPTPYSAMSGELRCPWGDENQIFEQFSKSDLENGFADFLEAKHGADIEAILEDGFSDKCGACVSHGHLVSRIRSTCLSISGKEVKRQLTKRGVKCAGCSSREHYVDRLLDVVHMPILNS